MAYDPNCAETKAAFKEMLDAATAELTAEHEADVTGLKTKNSKLISQLSEARKGQDGSAEIDRLEADLAKVQADLKAATKGLATATKERDAFAGERDNLNSNLTQVLVNQGLTAALTEAKVDPKFLPAVTAMLTPKVSLVVEGDNRKAVADGKSLGDFVKAWSQGDEGKAFVTAAGNSGSGAGGVQGTAELLRRMRQQRIGTGGKMGILARRDANAALHAGHVERQNHQLTGAHFVVQLANQVWALV